MRALAKCVCDSLLLHMAALKAGSQNFDVASRIFVKNGVSGSWRKSWMELRGRTLTIVDEESGEQYDLRKAVALSKLPPCYCSHFGTPLRLSYISFIFIDIVNIEYYESKADVVCAEASEESKPFILNMPGRTLYFQGDVEKSTAQWIKLIQQRSRECGAAIEDQPLTSEDVPVIVQKCIAFVERHGNYLWNVLTIKFTRSKFHIHCVVVLFGYRTENGRNLQTQRCLFAHCGRA